MSISKVTLNASIPALAFIYWLWVFKKSSFLLKWTILKTWRNIFICKIILEHNIDCISFFFKLPFYRSVFMALYVVLCTFRHLKSIYRICWKTNVNCLRIPWLNWEFSFSNEKMMLILVFGLWDLDFGVNERFSFLFWLHYLKGLLES